MIRVGVIENGPGLAELATEWNDLLRDSAADSAFLTFEWVSTWWRHFGSGRRLWVVTVRADGELVAIAPFVRCPRRLRPPRVMPALELIGSAATFADHLDVIVRRGREREAGEAVADAVAGAGLALDLTGLSFGSAVTAHVHPALSRHRWISATVPADVCPFITLAGTTWENYLASLGSQHRYNFRRRLRNLTRQFEMRFDPVTSEPARREAFAALVRLHNERWQSRGGSGAFSRADQVAFHDELTRLLLERGWLRLYVLRLQGAIVAALYAISYHGKFHFYQSGFDTGFRRHSIGLVTMGLAIEQAAREGANEFDLLRGTEDYKFLWAHETRQLRAFEASPPDLAHAAYRASLRAWRTARDLVRGRRPAAGPAGRAASPTPATVASVTRQTDLGMSEGKAGTGTR